MHQEGGEHPFAESFNASLRVDHNPRQFGQAALNSLSSNERRRSGMSLVRKTQDRETPSSKITGRSARDEAAIQRLVSRIVG